MSAVTALGQSLAWIRQQALWLWPVFIFALSGIYTIFFINPFSSSDTGTEAADVAMSWNASVSQLGISPLYPPQENFFVGDLWAIVTKAPSIGLLGRGVRLDHIDLSEAIKIEHSGQDIIRNTFAVDENNRDNSDNVTRKIKMFSMAFPGISVSNNADRSSGSSVPLLSFQSTRKSNTYDEIKIPLAESYGASTVEAMIKFYDYCSNEKTQIRCTESFTRNILAANLDADIGPSSAKKEDYQVRLQLITRVYLTKSISHRRVNSGNVLLDARTINSFGTQAVPQSNNSSGEPILILQKGSNINDIIFDEKFNTPLVFGFRSAIFTPK